MPEIETKAAETEPNVYADVYHVLLVGMFASSVLFAVGIVRALLHPETFPLTPQWVKSHYHWSVVRHGLGTGDPIVLMMLATILLILTPVTRVVVSIYAFFVDRDYKYVVVTSIVLLVIVMTVVAAHFGIQ